MLGMGERKLKVTTPETLMKSTRAKGPLLRAAVATAPEQESPQRDMEQFKLRYAILPISNLLYLRYLRYILYLMS